VSSERIFIIYYICPEQFRIMARFGTACVMTKPVKVFVPPVHSVFNSCKQELLHCCLHLPTHLSFYLIMMSEMLSFRVLFSDT